MSQVFIGNGRARLLERLDDSGNLERVPYQDGVGYQAQAARLVHDLYVRLQCCFSGDRRCLPNWQWWERSPRRRIT
jgi:hypothetical protein